jgi:hypothetical protein
MELPYYWDSKVSRCKVATYECLTGIILLPATQLNGKGFAGVILHGRSGASKQEEATMKLHKNDGWDE